VSGKQKHINNIFKEGELTRDSVCAKFAHTAEDGKTYQTQCFNLDAVISVGYRVKRFPDDFMFQLTKQELDNLRCQFGTSSWGDYHGATIAEGEKADRFCSVGG